MTRDDQAMPTFLPRNRYARAAAVGWLQRHGYRRPDWHLRLEIMDRLQSAPGPHATLTSRHLPEVRDWLGTPPVRHWARKPGTYRAARARALQQ